MTTRDFEEEKSASRHRDKRLSFRDGTEGPISREKEDPRRVMGRRVMGPRGDSTRKENEKYLKMECSLLPRQAVLVSLPNFIWWHLACISYGGILLAHLYDHFDLVKITNDRFFSAPNGVNITNDRFLLRMASWFLIL